LAENKTQKTQASVKDFMAKVKNDRRREDGETLLKLIKKVTRKQPVMWGPSIIGFDQVHYKYESGREGNICRIGFSPRSQALTLYISRGFDNCLHLLANLGKYKSSKACLYINKLDDVDMEVLEQLLKESYQHSLENNP
jgi:hypothetical protein